jgi:hypothetical protein
VPGDLGDRPHHPHDAAVQVESVEAHADGLTPAQAGSARQRHQCPVPVRDRGDELLEQRGPTDHDTIGVAHPPTRQPHALSGIAADQVLPHGRAENGTGEPVALGDRGRSEGLAEFGDPLLDTEMVDLADWPGAPFGEHVVRHDRGITGDRGWFVVAGDQPAFRDDGEEGAAGMRIDVGALVLRVLDLGQKCVGFLVGLERLGALFARRFPPVGSKATGLGADDVPHQLPPSWRPSSQA